jgi:ribosomal-protein-alanine N-acetyltransferase
MHEQAPGTAARQIRTRSLLLRPPSLADAESLLELYADPQTMQYWSSKPVGGVRDAARLIERDLACEADGRGRFWSVTLAASGRVIGKCALFNLDRDHHRAEVGYALNRAFWGQGIMTEALTGVIDYAFEHLGLHRLEADTDPDNAGSLALLNKLGFIEEGLFRERWNVYGEWRDSVMFGLLRDDWQAGG